MSYTIEKADPVLVGMSGGVDSSVCAQILKEQGFRVEGLAICFSPAHAAAVEAAERAAAELEIPLHVAHCEELFDESVVGPFCEAYVQGRTPNPCVVCNPLVKFRILAEWADKRGFNFIATGHYARVEEQDGTSYVAAALSEARDQSYMLYRLPQDILSRLILPLGEFEKDDIRQMARDLGLTSAEAPDSQEICFIPDGDYAAFIAARGHSGKPGRFIGPDGEDLGPHRGVEHYTVGQRRGTGLALGRPVFVKSILPNGDIRLGWGGEEYDPGVVLGSCVFAGGTPPAVGSQVQVKIRSAAKPVWCTVEAADTATAPCPGGESPDAALGKTGEPCLALRFTAPQRAAAPGQAAVLYRDGLVLGGGEITGVLE